MMSLLCFASGGRRAAALMACLLGAVPVSLAAWETDPGYNPQLPEAKGGYDLMAEWNGTVYLRGTDYTDYWNQVTWRRFLVKVDAAGNRDEEYQFPFRPETVSYHDFTDDGRMTVGGALQSAQGGDGYWLVRLLADGSLDPESAAVGAVRDGRQVDVNRMEDGRYLVIDHPGFTFQKDAIHLQRYRADLSPDESFSGPAIGVLETWFPAYFVREAAGGLLLGFNWRSDLVTVDGQPAKSLHRLTSSGAVDPAFAPYQDELDETGYEVRAFMLNDVKDDVALVSTDWAGESGDSPYIVRLRKVNAKTGAVDAAFQPDIRYDDGFAWALLVENGKVRVTIAEAETIIVNGTELPAGQQVLQLNADGTLDTGFQPGNESALPDPVVRGPAPGEAGVLRVIHSYRMQFLTDGRVILTEGGETFTEVNSVQRAGIALLNPDGSVDPEFAPVPAFPAGVDHETSAYELRNGDLLLLGSFVALDGSPRPSGVGRLRRIADGGQIPFSFAQWANAHGVPATPDAQRDTDGDGVPDLVEYVCNLDPRVNDSGAILQAAGAFGLPRVELVTAGQSRRLRIEFLRPARTGAGSVSPVAEFASDPAGVWQPVTEPLRVDAVNNAYQRVVVEDSVDTGAAGRRFARVRMTVNN